MNTNIGSYFIIAAHASGAAEGRKAMGRRILHADFNSFYASPDFESYQKFAALGRAVYGDYSDWVEAFGLDENWIDVTSSTVDISC